MDKRATALAWFTEQMRAKLELRRDHGDNWEEMGVEWLWERMAQEALTELLPAWHCLNPCWANVIDECADVSNFCLMLADTARQIAEAEAMATEEGARE